MMKHYKWIRWNGEVMVALFNYDEGDRNEFSLMGNDATFRLEANGIVYGLNNANHGSAEIIGEITPPHAGSTDYPEVVTLNRLFVYDHSNHRYYRFRFQKVWNTEPTEPGWFIQGSPVADCEMCRIPTDRNDALWTLSQYMNQSADQVAWIVDVMQSHCTAPIIDDVKMVEKDGSKSIGCMHCSWSGRSNEELEVHLGHHHRDD